MNSAIRDVILPQGSDSSPSGGELHLAPTVALALVDDGSSRLLDLGGRFYGLPPVSTEILLAALRGASERTAELVAARCGVSVDRVRSDARLFLKELARRRLLVRRSAARGNQRTEARLNRLLFPGMKALRRAFRACGHDVWGLLALVRLSIGFFGWLRTLQLCREFKPTGHYQLSAADAERQIAAIDRLVRDCAARHPLKTECKERAIACWVLLRELGLPARLVVGIDLYPFLGHCWCECQGHVVSDDAERCYRFCSILSYE
jgi:hypothetical protein